MARRARLDAELVRRGLARSRRDAADLVEAGQVTVAGWRASKPATAVGPDDPIVVKPTAHRWVSRGAHKLLGALEHFDVEVAGRRCLDAGASTGGFTQVLLSKSAGQVVAVDVGYGELAWELRTDERVVVVERTNVRDLVPAAIGGQVSVTVADLSFISLTLVLPALAACTEPDGDLVLMCKPQFEVGRDFVGAGGVVRDPQLRASAVLGVSQAASALGLSSVDVVASSLPGPAGNVEYFLWLRRVAAGEIVPNAVDLIDRAIKAGPQ